MLKVVSKIVFVLLGVLFVLGFIRFAINDFQGSFVPSWSEILGWLDSFPNISEEVKECMDVMNNPSEGVWGFFESVGAFFTMLWTYISAPFRVLGWFFLNFYTPTIS